MSEDIIERLRDYSSPIMGMDRIAGEAANEIESLRQQLADSQKQVTLLRDAMKPAMEFIPAGYGIERRCWEALDATEPK